MQTIAVHNSPHVLADQSLTLSEYRPDLFDKMLGGIGYCWLVTRPLAQALETAGEVVVTDGWSDWWLSDANCPEAVLQSLGLVAFLH